MHKSGEETAMVHFECQTCLMSATMVLTPSAELAWLDHMENHVVKDNFLCWTWSVLPLRFDP